YNIFTFLTAIVYMWSLGDKGPRPEFFRIIILCLVILFVVVIAITYNLSIGYLLESLRARLRRS
ncbi:MAG: hypothetical protein NTY03_16125, partial [Candidatus Bathyarchaeota archaeon]|nr:hypothetical protein [Candidatus Bathyarchaeota archaeon]